MDKFVRVMVLLVAVAVAAGCAAENRGVVKSASAVETPDLGAPAVQGVAGVVTSRRGPVEGAVVAPRSLDSPGRLIPEIAVLTDEKGHYSWSLLPGSYEIQVTADCCRPAVGRVTVVAGKVATLSLVLDPSQ